MLNVTALTESGEDPVITKYYFLALSKTGARRVSMVREGVVQWLVGDHGSAPKANCPLGRVGPEDHHLVKSYPLVQHSQNQEEIAYYNKYVVETNPQMLKILPALQQSRTFVL